MALPSAVDPGGFSTPPFSPRTLPASTPSPLATQSEPWVEVLVSSCHFGLNVFLATLKELCLHPERNSSLILRADPLPPRGSDDVREGERLGLELVEEVGVRLMPKQPKRDAKLEQRCLFYHSKDEVPDQEQGLVLYVPKLSSTEDAPFYYPPVQRLAFRWEAAKDEDVDAESEGPPVQGKISLAYLPWPETPATPLLALRQNKIPRKRSPLAGPPIGGDESESIPPPATILSESGGLPERKGDDRLQRTCLALLERLYKHGYGTMVGYRKRVVHDVGPPSYSADPRSLYPGTGSKTSTSFSKIATDTSTRAPRNQAAPRWRMSSGTFSRWVTRGTTPTPRTQAYQMTLFLPTCHIGDHRTWRSRRFLCSCGRRCTRGEMGERRSGTPGEGPRADLSIWAV
jgi:hypothetical protein